MFINKNSFYSKKHFAIESRYNEDYKYGFLVKNAKILKLIPYLGKLGFFEVGTSKLKI